MKMRLGWGQTWPEFESFVSEVALPGEDALRAELGEVERSRQSCLALLDQEGVMGEKRQRELMICDRWLLDVWSRHLPEGVPVSVDLQLLSLAWSHGELIQERPFDVLANRFPLELLHATLDLAARRHPRIGRHKLFRADAKTVRDENVALYASRRVVSAHWWVNEYLKGDGAPTGELVEVDWVFPMRVAGPGVKRAKEEQRIVLYPDHGLARRGALEVAAALARCSSRVHLVTFEGERADVDGCWSGLSHSTIREEEVGRLFEKGVDLVVLPSFIEYRPDVPLMALANDVPLIASTQCGIAPGDEGPGDGLRLFDRATSYVENLHHWVDEELDAAAFYGDEVTAC